MSRRHTFVIVVLLAAAAVAGLLAMTRTAALGSSAKASPTQEDAISFRLAKLDRLEASLRRQVESGALTARPGTTTLLSRSPVASDGARSYDDEAEHDDHEHEDDDAGFEGEDRDD